MIPPKIKLLDTSPGPMYLAIEINDITSYKIMKEKILRGDSIIQTEATP